MKRIEIIRPAPPHFAAVYLVDRAADGSDRIATDVVVDDQDSLACAVHDLQQDHGVDDDQVIVIEQR